MEPFEDQSQQQNEIKCYEREGAINYLLASLLRSRQNTQLPSNAQYFDEDVNVYLAHLLYSVCLPSYSDWTSQYICENALDVQERLQQAEDVFTRYLIFKLNGDHLLLRLSVFKDQQNENPTRFYQHSEGYYIETARSYLDQASSYNKRVYHKKTAVADILHKLSDHFDVYQKILYEMRREFFHFSTVFGDPSFLNFLGDLKHFESKMKREQKIDLFLDLYREYQKNKADDLKLKLLILGNEIRQLDQNFHFQIDMDSHDDKQEGAA